MIAPLTVRERMAARAAIVAEGGIYPSQEQMYEAMRTALRQAEPENLEELLGILDAAEATPDDKTLAAQVARIETACQASAAYTALLGQRVRNREAVPFVYFRHAVRGWEGDGLPAFVRRNGAVSEDALEAVPEIEIQVVGWKAYVLANPSEAAVKNSAAPSQSSGTQTPSRGASTRQAGARGSSARKSGQKIPD
jgi:hypothetical protein